MSKECIRALRFGKINRYEQTRKNKISFYNFPQSADIYI